MRITPANGTKIRELIYRILGGIDGGGHAETQQSRIPKPTAPSGGAPPLYPPPCRGLGRRGRKRDSMTDEDTRSDGLRQAYN